jgi:hypothetical protein
MLSDGIGASTAFEERRGSRESFHEPSPHVMIVKQQESTQGDELHVPECIEILLLPAVTRFYKENRMHLICAPGSEFHTNDRQKSVIP